MPTLEVVKTEKEETNKSAGAGVNANSKHRGLIRVGLTWCDFLAQCAFYYRPLLILVGVLRS